MPHFVGRSGPRRAARRLRDGGWVLVGMLVGVAMGDAFVTPLLASLTVPPAALGSLAVFAMLLGSVRDHRGVRPVAARLTQALLPHPALDFSPSRAS